MNLTESVWSYRVEAGVAVLTIDAPPVNALSHKVRIALSEGVARALGDDSAGALVIICAGRTFFAGADVSEIGKPIQPPLLGDVMALFEASTKPIVSAMHGTALGGGLELALAGHYRVAVPSAVVGLPEVALGLLPGAGGTQRVPRLIGVPAAIDMIGLGRHVKAPEALALGLIDQLVPEGDLAAYKAVVAAGEADTIVVTRFVEDLADLAATGSAFGFRRDLLPAGEGSVSAELQERLLAPALAEALTIAADGVARRSSDIDFAMVRVGLWPLWRGGPAFMTERTGAVVARASAQARAAAPA